MRSRLIVLAVAGLACLSFARGPKAPRLMWNATASVPVGLYSLTPAGCARPGDLVAVTPPAPDAALLAQRGWLPLGVPLLKPIMASTGQMVCRHGETVTIDGVAFARALPRDRQGRPLPAWQGCQRLDDGQVFVLSTEPNSFDGRYLGVTPRAALNAIARPLWIPSTPKARP